MEEWRDIKGYEGKYMVSNLGRFKSLNYRRTGKEKILEGYPDKDGYLYVNLCKDGKGKQCMIHRLVAMAFIPNPDNLPEVNHKDEDKTNNRVENLEWCSRLYNNTYNGRAKKVGKKLRGRKQSEEHIKKRAEKTSKPVYSIDKESGLITYWESIREAENCTGISKGNICDCLKGRQKSAGGYTWHYVESEEVCDE